MFCDEYRPNEGSRSLTSLIFAFKNGFLMYQVDVKKVNAKRTSSLFPDKSKLSGEFLWQVVSMAKAADTDCVHTLQRKVSNLQYPQQCILVDIGRPLGLPEAMAS
jgi:hypothetical protein